jgi:predicted alternative tryptophan synthase beta-subunit
MLECQASSLNVTRKVFGKSNDQNLRFDNNDNWIIISSVLGGSLVFLAVIIAIIYRKLKGSAVTQFTAEEIEAFYNGVKGVDKSDPLNGPMLLPYDTKYEIPRKNIHLGSYRSYH